jgi:small subunit ribosomal protein S19e
LIERVTLELQKNDAIKPPIWTAFAKTGANRESAPTQKDWWFRRCSSILRKLYIHGPSGVNRLRVKYGGREDRGAKPHRFRKGSGAVLRKSLQQLETAGLVKKVKGDGRVITSKGRSLLDKLANDIAKITSSAK